MLHKYSRPARFGRAALLAAGFALTASAAHAQLSGTYQIGAALTDNPTGAHTFQSLASALSSSSSIGLSTGVSGPVTFVLVDAAYPLGATALTVPAPAGASATNTVTVQPASGVTPLISGSLTGALITLDGTDYLTINGNDGSGGKAITIRNGGNGPAVLLQNDATFDNLRYLVLESAVTGGAGSTPTAGTVQLNALTGTTGDTNTLVEYCDVRAVNNSGTSVPTGAIYAIGTATVNSANVTVQNCNIYNFSAGGIYLDNTGGSAWTIQNNSFYQTATRSSQVRVMRVATGSGFVIQNNSVYQTAGTQGTPFYGVAVSNNASATVSGNTIGGSTATGTGSAMSFTGTSAVYGIYLSVGTATASSVQGNVVRNISSASTGTFYGLDLQNGTGSLGTTAGNVVGGTGTGQGITHAGTAYGLLIENASVGNVQNNTFAGITTSFTNATPTAAAGAGPPVVAVNAQGGTLAGVYVSGTGANTISNNTISTLSATTVNQSNTATLSATTATPVAGVYVSGTSTGTNTISGNTIGLLTSANTFVNNGTAALASAAFIPLAGVWVSGGGTAVITGNNVGAGTAPGGLTASSGGSPVYGVYVSGAAAATISGNTLGNLSGNTSTAAVLAGVSATGSGVVTVDNNTIGPVSQSGLTSNLYGVLLTTNTSGSGVTNNRITGVTYSGTSTGNTAYGIFASGNTTTATSITGNTITTVQATGSSKTQLRGIFVGQSAGQLATVTGNVISGVLNSTSGADTQTIGLYVGATSGTLGAVTVSTNLISNVGTTSTTANTGTNVNNVTGLQIGSVATGSVVERNRIWNVYGSTPGTGANADQVRALAVISPNTGSTSSATYDNNQLSLAAGSVSQVSYGILDAAGVAGAAGSANNYYYNSVNLAAPSAAATGTSYGFYRSATTNAPTVALLDNILYDGRTAASGTNAFAIGTAATGTFSSNYNLFVTPSATVVGQYGSAATDFTFAGWKTQSGGDNSSLSTTSTTVAAANLFVDPTNGNLNIVVGNPEAWYANGNGTQISGQTADYNSAGTNRSTTVAAGGTDIGSNEFLPTSTPPALTASAAPALGGTQTFTLGGRTLASLTYGNTGTVPTTVTARYYSGTNPPTPYASGARVANYYFDFSDGGTGSNYTYQPTLYYDPALLGAVPSESAQQLNLRNADNSGYRAFPTTVNTTARSLALANGGSFSRLGTLAVADQATPLPVTLAAFAALRQGDDVVLNWNSASELNSAGYEVQVSPDGVGYRVLGFVQSQLPNSATAQYYQYTDREAGKTGTRYYRLRQVDLNGRSAYSPVLAVAFDGRAAAPALLASPNPFAGPDLTLTLTAARAETATLTVLDAAGRPVLTQQLELAAGSNALAVPALAGLPAGLYLVQVATEGGSQHTRVVRQ